MKELLEESLCSFGDKCALRDVAGTLTFADLLDGVDRISSVLTGEGIEEGDCVAVDCDGRDLIFLSLAVMRSKGCAVAIPWLCSQGEREQLFEKCSITALLSKSGDGNFPLPLGSLRGGGLREGYRIFRRRSPLSAEPLRSLLPDARLGRFTSGTTGDSKGVVLRERSLSERITAANRGLQISGDDVILWTLPMAYHFVVSILLYLKSGACILVPPDHRPRTLARAIERDHATVIYANEHFFRTILSGLGNGDLGSVRKCFSTSVSLSEKTGRDFHAAFGVPICQAYGIIEVGLPAVNTDRPLEKAKSVGRLLPGYEIKILNDERRPVPPGGTGEIVLRGPGFLDAYLSPFRTRDKVCVDGWFMTGDLGRMDGDGYLYICGRRKSTINCMGMKVFPEEVEAVLDSHPYVRKTLVKGRAHPYLHEVPHAMITLHDWSNKPCTADMIALCRRHLSSHCIPRSFEFVDSLPETATGKMRRG